MVVKGLNKFINWFEQSIIDRIKIRDEISNWKQEHDEHSPVILIDLKDCPCMFVHTNHTGVILGGHYDRYNGMMHQFLENITKAGAKLVFFMPGRQHSDDLQFFIPKVEEEYINSINVLDAMEEQVDLKEFLRKTHQPWRRVHPDLSFNCNLKKLVMRFGDFHVTYEQHNQEIARYAIENRDSILAIISNDTDFVAFSGVACEFWYASSMNFKELACNRYNKGRLYDKLGFEHGAVQMQLLSALCCSEYLPFFAIEDFLDRLKVNENRNQRGKIRNVSAYVKRQSFVMVENKITYDLEQISRDVFGEGFSREQLNTIANGLAYYNLDFEYPRHRDLNAFLQFCKKHKSFPYKLATDDVFNVRDITYIDYRNYKSKSYAELVIPLLMKLCGILFKDDARRPIVRKICMKHAHDEPSKVTEEAVIYPSMKLPKLFEIMFKTQDQQYDGFRQSLLEWVLDLNDSMVNKIRTIKNYQRFAVAILTLHYLTQQRELTAKEANIILYTEHQIRNLGLCRVEYPEHPNAHSVRIAHLYAKIYVLVSHCFDICGLYHMTDLVRFDGPIFHKNMEEHYSTNERLADVLESAIQPIWIFS